MNLIPKVLIAAPVSSRHSHLLDDWIKNLDKLTYPNFEVLLVDTTYDTEEYTEILKTKKVNGKKINLLRRPWDYENDHVLQLLSYAREDIRKYFLEGNFDYLFFLDDDIFIPENSLQKLLSRNRDLVGFYVHIFDRENRAPCVLKSGEMMMSDKQNNLFSFAEIDAYKVYVDKFKEGKLSPEEELLVDFIIEDKWKPDLFKTYAVGIGCLMCSRAVMEETAFRTHDDFIMGEDIWWFAECNDKKFEFWLDTTVRAEHRNTNWDMVQSKGRIGLPKVYLAIGDSDAKDAKFLGDSEKKDTKKWKKLQL